MRVCEEVGHIEALALFVGGMASDRRAVAGPVLRLCTEGRYLTACAAPASCRKPAPGSSILSMQGTAARVFSGGAFKHVGEVMF